MLQKLFLPQQTYQCLQCCSQQFQLIKFLIRWDCKSNFGKSSGNVINCFTRITLLAVVQIYFLQCLLLLPYLKSRYFIKAASYVIIYLPKFRLKMNTGADATPSKNGAMYFSAPRRLYFDANNSWLDVVYIVRDPACFIKFTTEFKYIGSIVHHALNSDADMDKRNRHQPPLGLVKIF